MILTDKQCIGAGLGLLAGGVLIGLARLACETWPWRWWTWLRRRWGRG